MSARSTGRQLDLVFVIDPIDTLNAAHDTSVAMMESAQTRGHRVLVTTMRQVAVADARAVAWCTPVRLHPATLADGRWRTRSDWYEAGQPQRQALADADAVFVRTDPPVDAAYLRGTFLLDLVDPRHTMLINSPAGLRHANEKLFSLRFPQLCPETVVTAEPAEIAEVTRRWGKAVVKPTDGMAGRGIMLLHPDDPNLCSIIEAATLRGNAQVVVQRYLQEAAHGDRRVIVLDGVPIGAVRRVATTGTEFRCNMATGASVLADSVTSRDKEMCAQLAEAFAEHGLVFVGIDVIGDYLTEINVTSPTGVRKIDAFTGTRLSDDLIATVEQRSAKPR